VKANRRVAIVEQMNDDVWMLKQQVENKMKYVLENKIHREDIICRTYYLQKKNSNFEKSKFFPEHFFELIIKIWCHHETRSWSNN
jgi:hypothetical protein